jgi:membrane protein implicated in regulation of membrane protease activity
MGKKIKRRFHNDRNRQAFNHWRDHAINQMTAASSMIFGLASAGLAYSLTLLSAEKQLVTKDNLWTLRVFTVAFAVSFVVAILLLFNRLWGFRKAAEIVRARDIKEALRDAKEAGDRVEVSEVSDLREESGFIDGTTWLLFCLQVLSFVIGSVGIIYFMGNIYGV